MKEFPYIVDARRLKKFVRFEMSYDEMVKGNKNVVFDNYRVTVGDFEAAIANMRREKVSRRDFIENWFSYIFYNLYEELELRRAERVNEIGFLIYEHEAEIISCFLEWCTNEEDTYKSKKAKTTIPDYRMMLKTFDTYRANLSLPPEERKYTMPMKYATVKHVGNPDNIVGKSKEEMKLYKKFVNDLCRADIPFGLRVKGYSHLIGSPVFPQNRAMARFLFVKLYDKVEDAYIADIIGDLYYGGTEDEGPNYELAYQYYTISGLNGNQTSLLKMSDMLYRGIGTIKNEHVGKMIVFNAFDEAYNEFCRYNFNSLLADVTVRMGMIFDNGIDTPVDPLEASKFYNIAKYALKKRIAKNDNEADKSLYEDIVKRSQTLSSVIGSNPNASYVFAEIPNMLLACMVDNYAVSTTITKVKNEYKLVSRRIPKINEDRPQGILIEYPLNEYCALLEVVEEYMPVKGTKVWLADEESNTFEANEMSYVKDKKECVFKYNGSVVARIRTSMFSCRLKQEES